MKKQIILLISHIALLLTMGINSVLAQTVNPDLVEFHQRFAEKELVKLNNRVSIPVGYSYANFGFVEADDGVIVIDTGWFPGGAQEAWAKYQKQVNKPVKAIFYTHIHTDHSGGSAFFKSQANEPLEIYGPEGWNEWLEYSVTSQFPMIFRRAYGQMGLLLTRDEHGTVGSGIGPPPNPNGTPSVVEPTINIAKETEIEISGVRIRLIPSPGDIQSTMLVWLPDDKVLFSGDTLGGTFPYISTPRFEPDRDPEGFIKTLEYGLSLKPEHVVPGHGRLLLGTDDVKDVLQSNVDIIRYFSHQVERAVTNGKSADEIIDELKLPPKLAQHPDLQPHYHRIEWMVKGLALKQAGFVGDETDLLRLTDSQEAIRLVALLGGADTAAAHAKKALDEGDARWAARLATFVLYAQPKHRLAKDVRLRAFQNIASTTISANERNYLLTAIKEETDGVDWGRVLSPLARQSALGRSPSRLLDDFSKRYRGQEAFDFEAKIRVIVDNQPSLLIARIGTLYQVEDDPEVKPDAQFHLSQDVLERLWAKELSWKTALKEGDLTEIAGSKIVAKLVTLIE